MAIIEASVVYFAVSMINKTAEIQSVDPKSLWVC
jgi:hypothetical protein